MEGHTIRAPGRAAASPVQGLLRNFPAIFEQCVNDRGKAQRVATKRVVVMRVVGVGLSLWGPQTTEQLGLRFGQLGLNALSCERIEYPTWAFFGEAPTKVDTSMPLDQAVTLCIGQIVTAVERLTPAEREWLADCRFRKLQIGVTLPADIVHSARVDIDPNLSQRLAAAGIEPQIRTFPEPLDNIDAMNMPPAWARRMRRV